jgi:hypothetical protein
MENIFFNISLIVVLLLILITALFKRIKPASMITGIASIAYSLVFDIVFGELLGLYYYISPEKSMLYILFGAIFIYTPLNIIYTVFAPEGIKQLLAYTAVWTVVMLAFEYASLLTRTIIFTGWRMFPWSVVTYIATYTWINLFYRYLKRKLQAV